MPSRKAKNIKIALINPPLGSMTQPFVALPALQGHLRKHGYRNVRIWDVSQRLTCRLLSPDYLEVARMRLDSVIAKFEANTTLDPVDDRRYQEALRGKLSLSACAERTQQAIESLRDPRQFYDLEVYENAVHVLDLALEALSGLHYPQQIGWMHYTASLEQELVNEDEINAFVNDPKRCLFHREFETQILDDIVRDRPEVIGLSATFYSQFLPALLLTRFIKSALPDAHVVFGGAFVSDRLDEILDRPWLFDYFDSLIAHEGETPFLQLIQAIEAGRSDLSCVPNLYQRIDDIVARPKSIHTERLQDLTCPDYQGYDISDYFCPSWDLIYDPTRGCYWNKCTFCAVSLSARRTHSRMRTAATIVDDMRTLCDTHGTNVVTFGVDAIPVALMREVCEEVIRLDLDIGWSSEFILDKQLDRATIQLFAAAGCLLLLFGIESGSPRIIKLMKKGVTLPRASRIVQNCRESGITVLAHLMIGFPTETRDEVEQTIAFVNENKESIDIYELSPFSLSDKVPLFKLQEEVGIQKVGNAIRVFQNWNDRRVEVSTGLSQDEIRSLLPSVRNRIDLALSLKDRQSLFHLRQDTSHLHLYLKHLGKRPRELHSRCGTGPQAPGSL